MIRATIGNNLSRRPYILDENTTLRAALDQAEVDYSLGTTSLDGSSLAPGDLDKTFADLGVKEKCFLMCTVKADNAAAVKIVGNVAVVESGLTYEQLETLEKFRPKSLAIIEDKEEVFRIGTSKGLNGSISPYGASFARPATDGGKAVITLPIPEGTSDAKAWAQEAVGVSILRVKQIEAHLGDALESVATDAEAVAACIQVI